MEKIIYSDPLEASTPGASEPEPAGEPAGSSEPAGRVSNFLIIGRRSPLCGVCLAQMLLKMPHEIVPVGEDPIRKARPEDYSDL